MMKFQRSSVIRVFFIVPLILLAFVTTAAGLRHTAVLHEALLIDVVLVLIISAICRDHAMRTKAMAGCASTLLLLPLLAPFAFFPDTPAEEPRLIPATHGKTRILLDPCSFASNWEVLGTRVERGSISRYSLFLMSPDRSGEIVARVHRIRGLSLDEEKRNYVRWGMDRWRTGSEPVTAITFHSLPGLKGSRTSRGSNVFDLPADKQITEEMTVVAWDGYWMQVQAGCLAGNLAAKKAVDRVLDSFLAR